MNTIVDDVNFAWVIYCVVLFVAFSVISAIIAEFYIQDGTYTAPRSNPFTGLYSIFWAGAYFTVLKQAYHQTWWIVLILMIAAFMIFLFMTAIIGTLKRR
jgi:hypothetical protein